MPMKNGVGGETRILSSTRLTAAGSLALALASLFGCNAAEVLQGEDDGAAAVRNELRILLGRDLFFDKRLSADQTISCASCHDLELGGDDGLPTAVGINGAVGPINTPTVLNSGLNFAQFWDGRVRTLQEQAAGPVHNPIEMGGSWELAIERFSEDRELAGRFARAYEEGLTAESIADAIAVYETALLTLNSAFDRYQDGDEGALSAEAEEGYELFQGFGCISCHQGRAFGGNMFQRFGVMGDYFADRGLPLADADLGRYNVTGRDVDKFRFKVPSLRNVARTAPYFHDGSAATLPDAVALMAHYQLGEPATAEQLSRIVAFLESLNGEIEPRLRK
jgi:cytochrome c peroxidase